MKRDQKLIFSLVLAAFSTCTVPAKEPEEITLDMIYRSGTFSFHTVEGLASMNDGEHYTLLNHGRIESYSYRTGEAGKVLFDAAAFHETGPVSSYAFSEDERRILLETDKEPIYRHSYLADYFVYDIESGRIQPVSVHGKQQLGTFSPSGEQVAFVRDNNLYIKNLPDGDELQITFDGRKDRIINGAPDWVYEEEFGFSCGFQWSPDGRKIAYYRFDETRVREFGLTMYGTLYPETYTYKYPKAGEMNSVVSIRVYDLESGGTATMDTGPETDQYIPGIRWTGAPGILSILRLNRLQNKVEILHANASDGSSQVVFQEKNEKFISRVPDCIATYLPGGQSLILLSERSGYYQFYRYDCQNGEISPVTTGHFDVDAFLGYDAREDRLYYTSCEISPVERQVYSIRLDGSGKTRISSQSGTNSASFSRNFRYFILTHSSANTPPVYTLYHRNGRKIRVLEDNAALRRNMAIYGFSPTEFLTVHTAGGQDLNAWMIKPAGFDPHKKYPLFIYVYGGPQSQKAVDKWDDRFPWFQMLAQKGYLVACVDNRGTDGRGEEFRKSTYMALGKLETTDQLETAKWFGALDFVDETRMGIFGWSYGGTMASLCMTRGKGIFSTGIAVAPVTNWRYYDTIYTERFMRTPGENPSGYDLNSPIHSAAGLRGNFLLVHGTADDNVHLQNSMDFAHALVEADRQFEMQLYPNENHRIAGGNSTYHLYCRMTDFILENL